MSRCSTSPAYIKYAARSAYRITQRRLSPIRENHPSVRPRNRHCSEVGGNIRSPSYTRVYSTAHFVPQPSCRGGHGDETQWSIGQHDHASWPMDISHLPHVHPLTDWQPYSRSGSTNDDCIHVPECGLRRKEDGSSGGAAAAPSSAIQISLGA